MTPAAEKDIRSALRQLRGCIGRLEMARTTRLGPGLLAYLSVARAKTWQAEAELKALLNADAEWRALPGAEVKKR